MARRRTGGLLGTIVGAWKGGQAVRRLVNRELGKRDANDWTRRAMGMRDSDRKVVALRASRARWWRASRRKSEPSLMGSVVGFEVDRLVAAKKNAQRAKKKAVAEVKKRAAHVDRERKKPGSVEWWKRPLRYYDEKGNPITDSSFRRRGR